MKKILIATLACMTILNAYALELKLVSGEYGTKDKKVKVSLDKIYGIENGFYVISVENNMGIKDPVPGKQKYLFLKYTSAGNTAEVVIKEHDKKVLLPAGLKAVKEDKLLKAWYGFGKKWKDVTTIIAEKLASGKDFVVNNSSMKGDPNPGYGKVVICVMSKNGKLVVMTTPERKPYAPVPLLKKK